MGCGVCLERVERPRLVRTQCCLPGRLAAKPWWVRVSNTARVQHIRDSAGTALCWRRVCGRGLFLGCSPACSRCGRAAARSSGCGVPCCSSTAVRTALPSTPFTTRWTAGWAHPSGCMRCRSTPRAEHLHVHVHRTARGPCCVCTAHHVHCTACALSCMCAAGDGLRLALQAWLVHGRRAAG